VLSVKGRKREPMPASRMIAFSTFGIADFLMVRVEKIKS